MDSRSSQVDQLFAPWDRPDSPGCAIGIIKDGELIYARGYGMANLDYDIPLTPDSVFYFCSTSKQFAAASMLLLTQSGAVSLDDDIRKYVPEIPAFEEPITVRHLIHHTRGLRPFLELMTLAGEKVESIFDNRDVIEKLSRQKALNFPPGDQYQYSNSGYVLIAEIVARVSGKSLREFAAEKIFRPLGMDHTFWDDDHRQVVKNRVVSYSPAPGGCYWRFIKALETVGDGGLLTTVNDLVKWDRNFYDGTVGGPDFAAQMYTRGKLNNGETIFYAFGLGHEEYRGLHGIAHGGGLHGFRTEMFRFPEQRFTVICMTLTRSGWFVVSPTFTWRVNSRKRAPRRGLNCPPMNWRRKPVSTGTRKLAGTFGLDSQMDSSRPMPTILVFV